MSSQKKIDCSSNSKNNNNSSSFNGDWDVDKYRDEHECEEHWQLRKAFMEKWKDNYPEERLVCLARVFANVEFMGCRYPAPVMQEIAQLSVEVGKQYRDLKKTKLQRTFVSASDAAEDRARGIKRVGGEIVNQPKPAKIAFVPQGTTIEQPNDNKDYLDDENQQQTGFIKDTGKTDINAMLDEQKQQETIDANEYISEMSRIECINVRQFRESMLNSVFGRLVLLVRPWARRLWNIQTSCQVCGVALSNSFENRCYSLHINGQLLAQATGDSKVDARNIVEDLAWERLKKEVISVVIKEQFIAQGDARISVKDVSGKTRRDEEFGTPVENSVAMKMMQMMGWKGGGLGAEAQGIAEPIRPNLQLVNRAGLGSFQNVGTLRRAAQDLMKRYIASDTFDLDLVFSSEFTKEERATLHQIAQKSGLASRSYGEGEDRFLVVKKKLNPFSLVRAIIEKGGVTPKYQVFIPTALQKR